MEFIKNLSINKEYKKYAIALDLFGSNLVGTLFSSFEVFVYMTTRSIFSQMNYTTIGFYCLLNNLINKMHLKFIYKLPVQNAFLVEN